MHHFSPQRLAELEGLEVEELLQRCVQMGVPVFHGRIDRRLYEAADREQQLQASVPELPADQGPAPLL